MLGFGRKPAPQTLSERLGAHTKNFRTAIADRIKKVTVTAMVLCTTELEAYSAHNNEPNFTFNFANTEFVAKIEGFVECSAEEQALVIAGVVDTFTKEGLKVSQTEKEVVVGWAVPTDAKPVVAATTAVVEPPK